MPFRHVKKLIMKRDAPEEPMRKPILDSTPKQVSSDVYNLPTLDDLPELPQSGELYRSQGEEAYTPHPDIPTPQKRWEAPSEVKSYTQPVQPVQVSAREEPAVKSWEGPDKIVDILDRIERRIMDIDRRLAFIERSL